MALSALKTPMEDTAIMDQPTSLGIGAPEVVVDMGAYEKPPEIPPCP